MSKRRKIPIWALVVLGTLAFFLLIALFIGAVFSGIEGMMKDSGAYQSSLQVAKSSPCVAAVLGSPLQEGWFTGGSINETNDAGKASLEIPIHGPKDSGSLELEATRANGIWKIDSLVLAHRIDRFQLVPEKPDLVCK